jgi:hypothetical protein
MRGMMLACLLMSRLPVVCGLASFSCGLAGLAGLGSAVCNLASNAPGIWYAFRWGLLTTLPLERSPPISLHLVGRCCYLRRAAPVLLRVTVWSFLKQRKDPFIS